jgi:SAM-dependent methyltransferase
VSGFSAVDRADDPTLFAAYLDFTARGLAAMKYYVVAAHDAAGSDLVLDIGCGAGHDLELLAGFGIGSIGIDPSRALLAAADAKVRPLTPRPALLRADGAAIPFRSGTFGGCRIERVLQHVGDPAIVLSEAARCLRPGGLLTVFEPDWTTLRIPSDQFGDDATWLANVKQPEIGATLWDLVERAGCDVLDRVEELSVWTSLPLAERLISVSAGVQRAVRRGRFTEEQGVAWLAEQQDKERDRRFRGTIAKVLIVARKP